MKKNLRQPDKRLLRITQWTLGILLISQNIGFKTLEATKYIGAGLACSGLIGAGAGIGIIFSSLIASTARNPQIKSQLFSYAILGFALAEATGLFSLMIAFLLLYS